MTPRRVDTPDDPLRPIVQGARTLVGLAPAGGAIINAAGAPLEYLGGQYDADDERAALASAGIELRRAPSRAARRKLENLDGMPTRNLIKYGIQIAAGAAGGWIGAMVLGPVLPFGMLVGGLAGSVGAGYVAGRIYEGTIEKTEQDGVTLAASTYNRHRNHETVSREEAFATLVAVLPENMQAKYEDMLERIAGTRRFDEALQTREGRTALHRMMNDPHLEEVLRGYVHIASNPHDPGQHVADQYAELINNGTLDARAIILDPGSIRTITSRHTMQHAVMDNAMGHEDGPVLPHQQLPPAPRTNGRHT